MRTAVFVLVVAVLCAAPALAEESGRKAEVHLLNGRVVRCVVLGCSDGQLRFIESGQQRTESLGDIKEIVFGKAVGDHVRRSPPETRTPPDTREPTPEPPEAAEPDDPAPPRLTDDQRRKLHDTIRDLWRLAVLRRLEVATNHFRDHKRIAQAKTNLEAKLRMNPEKGDANRELRLALTVLAVAERGRRAGVSMLAALKKDYPDDATIQKLTAFGLEVIVNRSRRGLRRGPGARPRPLRPRLRDRE